MGGAESKNKKRSSSRERDYGRGVVLRGKVRQIQEEMSEMVCERKKESAAYERDMMLFAFKEAEWKQEKKKMREEVKMLRNMVEEKEERIRVIEGRKKSSGHENTEDWEVVLGSSCAANLLVEQMKEERARRDDTVEKWKQLYLAIKMELDDLIQRTHCGTGLYWRAEEEDIIVEELKRQLKAKEEIIAGLNSKIVAMEKEQYKGEREIDILRQSLRIMSSKKTVVQVAKNVSKDSQLVKKHARKL
ncbi:hypothetical protein ABKV19_025574 [Rosa sericea]